MVLQPTLVLAESLISGTGHAYYGRSPDDVAVTATTAAALPLLLFRWLPYLSKH
jgi:hypothetical protein